MRNPKLFYLIRNSDESGISGTGKVLEGVIWSNGKVSVCWVTENAPSSTVVYDSIDDFMAIHIQTHPTNRTELVFPAQGSDPEFIIKQSAVNWLLGTLPVSEDKEKSHTIFQSIELVDPSTEEDPILSPDEIRTKVRSDLNFKPELSN